MCACDMTRFRGQLYTPAVEAILAPRQRVLFEVFDAFAREAFGVYEASWYTESIRVVDVVGWHRLLDVSGLRGVRVVICNIDWMCDCVEVQIVWSSLSVWRSSCHGQKTSRRLCGLCFVESQPRGGSDEDGVLRFPDFLEVCGHSAPWASECLAPRACPRVCWLFCARPCADCRMSLPTRVRLRTWTSSFDLDPLLG